VNGNFKRAVMAGLVSAAMLGGGVIGATMFSATTVFAASNSGIPTNVRAAASPAASRAPGTFVSNEDPAHEATESAAREAQENAGQKPTVP
jgi:hypothetical protein